ncbi:hypothetical protein Ahy_A10g048810 [Arachis hypogaea]|uniref:Protein FAR1-RELATED SEQUENCE n=1 Tax=Arachis hypogaea TaxID=3818 RepID=A0A445B5Y5_ARAHY|nr:hypothetical protein Ahy_A10g048810 [Arachis hypogaea]
MKEINSNLFYAVDIDKANKFRSVLLGVYEYYRDMVSFDTTYRRNNYLSVHDGAFHIFVFVDLYDNRRIWVSIFFQDEFWTDMRSTQRVKVCTLFTGFLHCNSGLVQFVHEYDNEQKEVEDDATDSKGVIPYSSSYTIEKQFQQEYTSSMFREVQQEFRKKGNCLIRGVTQVGDSFCVNVDERYLFFGESRYCTNSVDFDPLTHKVWSECNMFESRGILCCHYLAVFSYYRVDIVSSCYRKNVQCKHTYIKSSYDVNRSDESHNLFRGLCSYFFNVAQNFVTCDEEAAMLHLALDDVRAKLVDYHTNLGSKSVAAIQYECVVGPDDIRGPSKVESKGWPRSKRFRAKLDRLIKKYIRRRKRNTPPICENDVVPSQNVVVSSTVITNES